MPQDTIEKVQVVTQENLDELRQQFYRAITGHDFRPHPSGENEVLMGEPVVVWPPVN